MHYKVFRSPQKNNNACPQARSVAIPQPSPRDLFQPPRSRHGDFWPAVLCAGGEVLTLGQASFRYSIFVWFPELC